MKFAHRILISQSVSHNLCFYQVLPVSASHDLSSICFLTYAIPRQVSSLLLSIYRLTIFGYFFSCTVAYMLHLNSTTVCFVYKRSRQWCGQAITTAADRSVGLWPAPPNRHPPHLVDKRNDRLMAPAAFRNFQHPTVERIWVFLRFSGPQYCTSTVNQHGAQITVAALANVEQNRFATGAVRTRCQSQQRQQHPSALDCLTITENCHQSARPDRPESWNLHNSTHWL